MYHICNFIAMWILSGEHERTRWWPAGQCRQSVQMRDSRDLDPRCRYLSGAGMTFFTHISEFFRKLLKHRFR